MRQILFRGKRMDGGGWGYGSLVVDLRRNLTFIVHAPNPDMPPISTPVRPETVGQFTGLTDKNGTKIFEGDIISDGDPMNEGEVEFDADCGWVFVNSHATLHVSQYCNQYWVIGNIHDDKTLES